MSLASKEMKRLEMRLKEGLAVRGLKTSKPILLPNELREASNSAVWAPVASEPARTAITLGCVSLAEMVHLAEIIYCDLECE